MASNDMYLIFGHVGIGTTSPGSKIQVNGNAAIGYSTSTAGPTNGLTVSGNVGIRTTAPTQALDIGTGFIAMGWERTNATCNSSNNCTATCTGTKRATGG